MNAFAQLKGVILPVCMFLSLLMGPKAHAGDYFPLEELINRHLDPYTFSLDNRFKLAAYAELKGRYNAKFKSLDLDFGPLGSLSFYRKNCLLKSKGRYFSLNAGEVSQTQIDFFEQTLAEIFEQINLMGNYDAPEEVILFVDRELAKKNLEPFEKLYTRHILIRHGRYDSVKQVVEFQSRWLPKQESEAVSTGYVKQYSNPLRMSLDTVRLHGWYERIKGYVFVENVKRDVFYATGEEYRHNVTAYKLFVQKMFVQSATFIAKSEAENPKLAFYRQSIVNQTAPTESAMLTRGGEPAQLGRTRGQAQAPARKTYTREKKKRTASRYKSDDWVDMLMSSLRRQKIDLADPEVLRYLIKQPYFEKIYYRMNESEREGVKRYRRP